MFGSISVTSRRRLIAALVAGSTVISVMATAPAPADELDHRKNRVQREIRRAERHLDQSSAALVRAANAVEAAEAKLASATRDLATSRGELAAAEVVDNQMQARLAATTLRLEHARRALRQGRQDKREQELALGQIAVQTYQIGDPSLVGLAMVLSSDDPALLTSQLGSVQNVLDKESATLSRLEASRVLLALQERRVEEARVEVAYQRNAAAETLARKQDLEIEAEVAAAKVTHLLQEREKARTAAARAKAEDLRQLRQLEKERRQISDLLKKRAAEARKRARAAAKSKSSWHPRGGGLSYPVHTYITSRYGMRLHPVYHRWTLHDGTDFGASCGTPVRAAAAGRVIAMYYNVGYGRRVIIDHGYMRGAGVSTTYNHLRRYSTHPGERVKRGEVIGYVGSTGYSTGCHLHFMVFRNGRTVDPMNWL